MNKCINCGEAALYTWFCPECTRIKEASYKKSAELNENYSEVMRRRDKALKDYKLSKIKNSI